MIGPIDSIQGGLPPVATQNASAIAPSGSAPMAGADGVGDPSGMSGTDSASFKDVLMRHIDQVNALAADADKAIDHVADERNDQVAKVMIAKTKTDLAFQTLLQVRQQMAQIFDQIQQMKV